MKKIISTILMAVMICMGVNAQSAAELARQQKELDDILRKSLNAKPTKDAKKQAKELKKEKWTVPAGDASIERQITQSQLLGAELMSDETVGSTRRFIQHTAVSTAGTYNVAYAAARANAQAEIASMIETEIAAALQIKGDNGQMSATSATTVDKFHQRIRAIAHESLTNAIPVLSIYRTLPNGNFEVQVRIAFDKKEVAARLKRNLQQELEIEGDELDNMIGGVLNNTTL